MLRLLIAACLLVMPLLFVSAADIPSDSQKPHKMMSKLAELAGSWSVERLYSKDAGNSWAPYAKAQVQVKYQNKKLMLEQLALQPEGQFFNMRTFISYDQYQEVFRQVAIEDRWGFMDISQGKIVGDMLVLSNTHSKTYYPMDGGRLRALKVRMQLTSPLRTVFIDESYDDGKTWAPVFKMHYRLLP